MKNALWTRVQFIDNNYAITKPQRASQAIILPIKLTSAANQFLVLFCFVDLLAVGRRLVFKTLKQMFTERAKSQKETIRFSKCWSSMKLATELAVDSNPVTLLVPNQLHSLRDLC
jgi:hypothetical protein